jgi:hypothetical protein
LGSVVADVLFMYPPPGLSGGSPDSLALLDPRSELRISDMDTLTALSTRQSLITRRAGLRPHRCRGASDVMNQSSFRLGTSCDETRAPSLQHTASCPVVCMCSIT